MKLSASILLLIIFCSTGRGQAVQSLTVGDKMPDIEINNIINYHKPGVKVSDFKDKLILIDFWGTTCSSCIEALPKIDSLQAKFKNDMQVFTVTSFDTEEKVNNALYRMKKLRNLKLPVVLGDKLKEYFPHDIVSHVVWIDGKGIVKAITNTEYITAQNIKKVLSGESINWPVKKDVLSFDYMQPFLELSRNNTAPITDDLLYYSAFTGYMQGVDATSKQLTDSIKNIVTENHFNHSLLQLGEMFVDNLPGVGYPHPKRIVFKNVKDKSRYIQSEYFAEWAIKNTYCYSISLPSRYDDKARRKIVKEDLRRWFAVLGISIKIEKVTIPCLKLVKTHSGTNFLKSDKLPAKREDKPDHDILVRANSKDVISYLNFNIPEMPWVNDSTGMPETSVANLLIPKSATNLKTLNEVLKKFGLQLIAAESEMDVYVIEEQSKY